MVNLDPSRHKLNRVGINFCSFPLLMGGLHLFLIIFLKMVIYPSPVSKMKERSLEILYRDQE